jgi:hypothetical protein
MTAMSSTTLVGTTVPSSRLSRQAAYCCDWLLDAFVPADLVVMDIAEPIARRQAARISAKGAYRDLVRASHAQVVNASGLSHSLGVRASQDRDRR